MDANQQDLVAQFCGVTGANASQAQTALASANWNLEQSVQLYFAAQEPAEAQEEDDSDDEMYEDDAPAQQPAARQPAAAAAAAAGGRTLGGEGVASQPMPGNPAAPKPSSSSSSRQKPAAGGGKMRTLKDIQGGGDDEDDDSEDEKKRDLFAGGEKSGLAVQDPSQGGPRNHFEEIMRQARQNRDRPAGTDEEDEAPQQAGRSSAFQGRAQTLGGDDAPSTIIDDPRARPQRAARPERINRTMHLWADGVSIDDGPLFRFDDPANAGMMEQINRGRAPLSLLDVAPDQEVDLTLDPHKEENYVKPKGIYKPFGGSGQRLGSPTPGAASSTPTVTTGVSSSAALNTTTASASASSNQHIDESQPTLTLQIRLGDGTRLQSRFNTSHTIGDVYDFVGHASPASQGRSWALMTTFPSKELSDKAQVLGDMSDFKRGGVVVQKWK